MGHYFLDIRYNPKIKIFNLIGITCKRSKVSKDDETITSPGQSNTNPKFKIIAYIFRGIYYAKYYGRWGDGDGCW